MSFLIVDINHFGAKFASVNVAPAVSLVKVDLVGWKFFLTVFTNLEVFLLFHKINNKFQIQLIGLLNGCISWGDFIKVVVFIIIVWTAIVTANKFGSGYFVTTG